MFLWLSLEGLIFAPDTEIVCYAYARCFERVHLYAADPRLFDTSFPVQS